MHYYEAANPIRIEMALNNEFIEKNHLKWNVHIRGVFIY